MEKVGFELSKSTLVHFLSKLPKCTTGKGSIQVQKLLTSLVFYNVLSRYKSFEGICEKVSMFALISPVFFPHTSFLLI